MSRNKLENGRNGETISCFPNVKDAQTKSGKVLKEKLIKDGIQTTFLII